MPMGFGDDMMHFNGIGEQIVWAINNAESPTPPTWSGSTKWRCGRQGAGMASSFTAVRTPQSIQS